MRCHPFSVLSTVATALLGGLASPHMPHWDWGGMRVMHAWSAIPKNWESIGHPHAEATIDLYLALKSHHEDALIDVLNDVSNPKHPRYGAYLSQDQVTELVAPHPDTLELVRSWLEHHRVLSSSISTTLGGNWLMVADVPVSRANEILSASYQLYHHAERNDTVLRTISYSLPEGLHEHIQTVAPTTYFGGSTLMQGTKRRMRPSEAVEARAKVETPGELVTGLSSHANEPSVKPSDVRWLYNTIAYVPAAVDRNELGIGGFSDEFPSPEDLFQFMNEYRIDGGDAYYTVELVNAGGYDPDDPGLEANLDVQYAEAIAYPTPVIYYSTAGTLSSESDPYIHWLAYLIDQKTIPQTISTSYADYEYGVPPDYAYRICYLLAQPGARGVSVLFSSSDWGVGQGDCTLHDALGNTREFFLPIFPATCPYVTTVGGTQGGTMEDDAEVAASFSGGGFSTYFPRPIYQDNAVNTFLQNFGDKYSSYYNPGGRRYPDVSAQAFNLAVVYKGVFRSTFGTSVSTPIVAGIISLLNDYLISKGEPVLGFLNPWIYSYGVPGFNDITSGTNPGCDTEGFSAIVGWDPVTGLGTPNFDIPEEIIDDRLMSSGPSTSGPSTSSGPSSSKHKQLTAHRDSTTHAQSRNVL